MPMITREKIVARIAELKAELEIARQRHTMLSGALADAEFWLSELERSEAGSLEPKEGE